MRASPKFLRHIWRGSAPIEVVASIYVAHPGQLVAGKPGICVMLLEREPLKPKSLKIVMSPDEARSLARSLTRFAEAAGNPKHNHADTDRIGESAADRIFKGDTPEESQ